jgi:hypothetical protein
MAAAYAAPVLCLSAPLTAIHVGAPGWPLSALTAGWSLLAATLTDARPSLALALAALAMLVWSARGWRRARRSALGLLALGAVGSGLAALLLGPTSRVLSTPLTVVAMAAAFGLRAMIRPEGEASEMRASFLLGGASVAAGAAALALGLVPAPKLVVRNELARAVEAIGRPGSLYVWSRVGDTELYAWTGAVPALPQVYTWPIPGIGPAAARSGFFGQPLLATVEGVDGSLARAAPQVLFIGRDMPDPAAFARFGPILAARYRLAAESAAWQVYRLRGDHGGALDSQGAPVQDASRPRTPSSKGEAE